MFSVVDLIARLDFVMAQTGRGINTWLFRQEEIIGEICSFLEKIISDYFFSTSVLCLLND